MLHTAQIPPHNSGDIRAARDVELLEMLWTRLLTVATSMQRATAISRLAGPASINSMISASRAVQTGRHNAGPTVKDRTRSTAK
jgi:hypothetical protein